jgi:hypothetical protein
MTEGPIIAAVLEKENAVEDFRKLIGATNPANAADGTIRKLFATDIERNAVHGSDSDENAAIEASFHFSGLEKVLIPASFPKYSNLFLPDRWFDSFCRTQQCMIMRRLLITILLLSGGLVRASYVLNPYGPVSEEPPQSIRYCLLGDPRMAVKWTGCLTIVEGASRD